MSNTSHPFSRESQFAVDHARRIAEGYKLPSNDSLILLLALLQLRNSRVQSLLHALNVKVENLAARITATLKLETKQAVSGVKDPAVEYDAVLNASLAEMQARGLTAIDEYSILLGMLRIPASRAGEILTQYALTPEQVRGHINVMKGTPTLKSEKPVFSLPKSLTKGMSQGISPIFISLALFVVAMAVLLWFGVGNNPRAFLIAFVMGGWIVSVALHEFGHAIAAFWSGDESVADKGYLTLNPLKYSNPFLSLVIPVLLLLMGGIGFPGGAVYINIHALRKPNYRSLVSAAGPLANILCALLLILPFDNLPYTLFFWRAPEGFLMGIAFLAFLQITAIMLNLLPIPGLDGFGILEPFLPRELLGLSNFIRPFGFMILYLFVFIDSPISDFFWNSVWAVTSLLNLDLAYYANEGLKLFLGN